MIWQMCEQHKNTDTTWECSRCKKPKCEKCKSPTGVCKKCSDIISHKRVIDFVIDFDLCFIINVIAKTTGIYALNIISIFYILLRDFSLSLGKYIIGLKVVTADTDKEITVIHSIKRNLIFLIPLSPIIEYIFVDRNKNHRRLGDKFANTKVIELSPLKRDSIYQSFLLTLLIILLIHIIIVVFSVIISSVISKSMLFSLLKQN